MKKFVSLLLILMLCLSSIAALAQTETEFQQSCWVKTAGTTTLYKKATEDGGVVVGTNTDLSGQFVEAGSLPGGTYLQITASAGSYDLVAYWGGSGYIKSSDIVSATTVVRLDDGTTVEVAEALAKDPTALLSYLSKTYPGQTFSTIEGSSVIHVGSAATGKKTTANTVSALPAPTVYFTDEMGVKHEVELVQLGLGYSAIIMDGSERTVLTTTVSWETEAKKNKVIALVNAAKTGSAPLLAEAKKQADVLDDLTTGTVVAVMKVGSSYTRVYANGQVGFVKTSSLKFQGNKAIKGLQSGYLAYNGNLNSNNEINVRSASKKNARIVGTYASGTPITILNLGKTWSEIEVGSLHCFVLSEFVTTKGANDQYEDDVIEQTTASQEEVYEEDDYFTDDEKPAAPAATEAPKETQAPQATKKPAAVKDQTIVVGGEMTIGYGSYEMTKDYQYPTDYEDDDRFFFDEEY